MRSSGPVIVTGSDSDLGRATAIALALAGHDVGVTWDVDRAAAAATAAAVRAAGATAVVRRIDPCDRPDAVIADLSVDLGGLWGLVGCPEPQHRASTLDEAPDSWRRALETGLTGPFLCAQAAARRLVAAGRGGHIVLVASPDVPGRFVAARSAAAAALRTTAAVMALELATFHVAVHAVARDGGADRVAAAIADLVGRTPTAVSGCRPPARPR